MRQHPLTLMNTKCESPEGRARRLLRGRTLRTFGKEGAEGFGLLREDVEQLVQCGGLHEHLDLAAWPEDLEFLSNLLDTHTNLSLDTSATKWMVRELSKHSREDLIAFLTRYSGRILFGSDIVTTDQHLGDEDGPRGMGHLASAESEAFALYASRYWALRNPVCKGSARFCAVWSRTFRSRSSKMRNMLAELGVRVSWPQSTRRREDGGGSVDEEPSTEGRGYVQRQESTL